MSTKLQAADVACRAGIDTIIAAGSKPGVIGDVMEGIFRRYVVPCQETPLENRKRWIFGAPPAGEITVDEGATAAILERGSSLLPKGIKSVTGNFSRGEVIRILQPRRSRYRSRRQSLQQRCITPYCRTPLARN